MHLRPGSHDIKSLASPHPWLHVAGICCKFQANSLTGHCIARLQRKSPHREPVQISDSGDVQCSEGRERKVPGVRSCSNPRVATKPHAPFCLPAQRHVLQSGTARRTAAWEGPVRTAMQASCDDADQICIPQQRLLRACSAMTP